MALLFFPEVTLWDRKPLFFHPWLCLYCLVGAKLFLLRVQWPLMLEEVRTLVTEVFILTAPL